MKLRYKGMIVLTVMFFAAGICGFACACERSGGGSERKRMNASGGRGFHRMCKEDFGGHRGDNGNHKGWGHEKHHGRHHRGDSSGNDQSSTGTDTGSNQSASDPTNADKYPDSAALLTQAWNSFNEKDYATASAFANEAVSRYGAQADEQQASLDDFAPEGSEAEYWALNDVATALFVLGSSYKSQGDNEAAAELFNKIISDYSYAQCYDPAQDIYWKVAEAAQKELE